MTGIDIDDIMTLMDWKKSIDGQTRGIALAENEYQKEKIDFLKDTGKHRHCVFTIEKRENMRYGNECL